MKRIFLTSFGKRISKIVWCKTSLAKEIIDEIISEMEYEILQWNRIIIPRIISINKDDIKPKNYFNTRTKKICKVKNKFKMKWYFSPLIKDKINFSEKKD